MIPKATNLPSAATRRFFTLQLDSRFNLGTLCKGDTILKPCVILLVEDDANDAFFISRALDDLGFNGHLEHVTNTGAARDYVMGSGKYSDREKFPPPEIVVSDS